MDTDREDKMGERYDEMTCPKCGAGVSVHWHPFGWRLSESCSVKGLFAKCVRCGYDYRVEALDEETE